jgi:hypothetical protein
LGKGSAYLTVGVAAALLQQLGVGEAFIQKILAYLK